MVARIIRAFLISPNNELYGANVPRRSGTAWAPHFNHYLDPEIFLCQTVFGPRSDWGKEHAAFYDPGHIMLPNMKDFLLTTQAEEAGIKFQYYCAKGGTDAGAAHFGE